MIPGLFNEDGHVRFEEVEHKYFVGNTSHELKSVSNTLDIIKPPFDRQGISKRMAEAEARKSGGNVGNIQARILSEWDAKKDSAIDRGNWIHNALEDYAKFGTIEPKLQNIVDQLQFIFKDNYRVFPEALIYNLFYGTSGQSDLVTQRQRTDSSVFDFWDYKTNESKGIYYDSIKRLDDLTIKTHYNQFYQAPFDHLEYCNYIHYSLQLSIYAYMAQATWGIKVGRLCILFIDNNLKLHKIPVPYMKLEAKALLDLKLSLKPLPKIDEAKVVETNDDDW
jgi:hypothetical protein